MTCSAVSLQINTSEARPSIGFTCKLNQLGKLVLLNLSHAVYRWSILLVLSRQNMKLDLGIYHLSHSRGICAGAIVVLKYPNFRL